MGCMSTRRLTLSCLERHNFFNVFLIYAIIIALRTDFILQLFCCCFRINCSIIHFIVFIISSAFLSPVSISALVEFRWQSFLKRKRNFVVVYTELKQLISKLIYHIYASKSSVVQRKCLLIPSELEVWALNYYFSNHTKCLRAQRPKNSIKWNAECEWAAAPEMIR